MPATIDVTSANRIAAAVVMLLGSNARAPEGTPLPDSRGDRQGWWADRKFGGLVYLNSRNLNTTAEVARFIAAAKAALRPLITTGVADSTDFSIDDRIGDRATLRLNVVKAHGALHAVVRHSA